MATMAVMTAVSCAEHTDSVGREKGYGQIAISGSGSAQVLVTGTRQEGTVEIDTEVPAIEAFALTVTDSEGESQQWPSVTDYSAERHYFPAGEYTVHVSNGNIADEGYDLPYFEGEAKVTVEARKTVTATVTAYIANTVVAVECTDNFNKYFTSSEFTVSTKAGNEFTTTAPMARPLFIQPQEFGIVCTAVKQTGESVTLPKQIFTTVNPQTRYTVKFDVAQAGGATVTIELNDTVIEEIALDAELNDDALNETTTEQ